MDTDNQVTNQSDNDRAPEGLPSLMQIVEKQKSSDPFKKFKKKRSGFAVTLIRIIISLLLIAGGIYLILFLVARAAKYDSIQAMLQSMFIELELMWQRIIY